ncbi:MAG: hypothetical protein EXQ55_01115 [Acidobacteria bacterium]|nr:hypothetical protein [Acidobacteriota bacterium]
MTKKQMTLAGFAVGILAVGAVLSLRGPSPSAPVSGAEEAGGVPTFQVDPAWPPQLPNDWVMGRVSSVAVDRRDHVWVLHRPRIMAEDKKDRPAAPPVLEFDAEGKFVQAWGGAAAGYEWPENEHGIYVDDKDIVWVGGQAGDGSSSVKFKKLGERLVPVNDDMLLKFATDGTFLQQIGRQNRSRGNQDTENLNGPTDLVVYRKTNEVFIADGYGNRRVIVLDADTGAFKRMWGAFGNVPIDAPPVPLQAGLAGTATASSSPAPAPPNPSPEQAPLKIAPGPQQFAGPVHGIKVSNDELVYVADRSNGRVQVFTLDGKYVSQLFSGRSPGAVALSPDPQQRFLFVGDAGRIVVVNRKTLEVLSEFRSPGHQIATDSKGNLYTAGLDEGTQKWVLH